MPVSSLKMNLVLGKTKSGRVVDLNDLMILQKACRGNYVAIVRSLSLDLTQKMSFPYFIRAFTPHS